MWRRLAAYCPTQQLEPYLNAGNNARRMSCIESWVSSLDVFLHPNNGSAISEAALVRHSSKMDLCLYIARLRFDGWMADGFKGIGTYRYPWERADVLCGLPSLREISSLWRQSTTGAFPQAIPFKTNLFDIQIRTQFRKPSGSKSALMSTDSAIFKLLRLSLNFEVWVSERSQHSQ
ncbi:hypothetical protein Hypma_001304 [Hypsizygus marmoreus]|uniref:Uncharacterized protein n=1 Tax=Hypsizygus marmoreus TaxID=39966 RepID=A0A369K945_HYPMA|nr:hypothetical protein Hypma_001304 [Hypsizygus marmoreus]